MRKKRLRLGDIYEIPLPNGKNAYGRLYKEYTLAIYKKRCTSIEELPNTEEDAWAPPQCVVDAITKIGSLYYKGEIKPCTYEECKDLEVVAAWDRHHIIDRLMGNADWMKFLDKPINPEK